jgi:gamma-glutamyltranspeptidase/glutathione hydrolase
MADPQQAIDTPRVFFDGDTVPLGGRARVGRCGLKQLGQAWRRAEPGGAQAVVIDRERGVLTGASDPRKDGMALGY